MPEIKTLVFIRGWASTDYSFRKFLQSKPDNWQIILLAADELIIDNDLVEAVEKMEERLKKTDRFYLAGHSLGGALALSYAAKYPDKVRQLYLINSVGYPLEGKFGKESLKMLLRNSQKAIRDLDKKFIESLNFLKKPHFHLKLGRFARQLNILPLAMNILLPTVIIHGEADRLVSFKVTQEIHQSIKGSKLKILPYLDHDWIQTHPQEFWKQMEQTSG